MREGPPDTWRNFARYVGLSDALSHRCWQGLRASPWPTVVAVRTTFLLHDALVLDPRGLTRSSADPGHMIQVIENLFAQGLLTAVERVQVEDILLAATTAEGRWKTRAEKGASR